LPDLTNEIFKRDPASDGGGGGNGGASTDDANESDNDINGRGLPRRSARVCCARQPGTLASTASGTRKLELNADVIADILAATHALPSWKASQKENTSWQTKIFKDMFLRSAWKHL
jgi:hypothetical protein